MPVALVVKVVVEEPAYADLDATLPPGSTVQLGDWATQVLWQDRPLPKRLMLVGVPPDSTADGVRGMLRDLNIPVARCGRATSSVYEGTANFRAFEVVTEPYGGAIPGTASSG